MKCYICGKQPVKDNISMFPVDKAGTPNRRWACLDHTNLKKIPDDVKELCSLIDKRIDGGKGNV